MTLSLATLDRLVAKDGWTETRWISQDLLARLERNPQQKTALSIATADGTISLCGPGSIGASLHPVGHSYCAAGEGIFALARDPYQILRWPRLELPAETWHELDAPSTLLICDGRKRWLSWISLDAAYTCWTKPLESGGEAQLFCSLPALPYGQQWHASRDLCIFLLCPEDLTPWQGASLYLMAFRLGERGPRPTSEQRISPPGWDDSPCQEACFSQDGSEIIGLWRTGEWNQLWAYDLELLVWTQLSHSESEKGRPRRRCDGRSFLALDDAIIAICHERGYAQLLKRTREDPRWEELLPREYTFLDQLAASPNGDRVSVISSAAHIPPTQLELRSGAAGWKLDRLRGPKTGPGAWVLRGESLSWPAEDGSLIHGIFYRDRRRSGPLPLLLPLHGGPTEQVSAGWPIKAQAFVESGYAVLYVNYRGSWGYGLSYQKALKGRFEDRAMKDVVSGIQHLAAADWIDPQRVALWGGDIAGSLVLHGLSAYPSVFRAGIAVFPIFDFADYWRRAHPLQRAELDEALGSHSDEERRSASLLSCGDRIDAPLALFHGGRDPLVPLAHAEALEAKLKSRGVPCWLSIYENEGHAWQARKTLEDYYCKIGSFLARFLRR